MRKLSSRLRCGAANRSQNLMSDPELQEILAAIRGTTRPLKRGMSGTEFVKRFGGLIPPDELDRMAAGKRDVHALSGWRKEIFGDDAVALIEGRLALALQGDQAKLISVPIPL